MSLKAQANVSGQTIDSPSFTGTRTGDIYPLAMSWVAVNVPADTTEDTLVTITVPANTLRANDALRITTTWSVTNNANAKTARIHYSGAGGNTVLVVGLASVATYQDQRMIANRNSTSSQVFTATGGGLAFAGNTAALTTATVDTTASSTIVITGQKGVAGDTMTLEGYLVEVIRP